MRYIFIFLLCATPAFAKPKLGDQPRIVEGLIAVAIAYEIGRVCPEIQGRRLRGLSYLMQLKGVARDLGYTNAEIDAFVDDRAEKDRLEATARARLVQKGAERGNVAQHCEVGHREINNQSVIGTLLRG